MIFNVDRYHLPAAVVLPFVSRAVPLVPLSRNDGFVTKLFILFRYLHKRVFLQAYMADAATLKQEITRLTLELDQASHEKIQAAQYGLQVLEEKQKLQARCEELEGEYEATRHELECAKEVGFSQRNFVQIKARLI